MPLQNEILENLVFVLCFCLSVCLGMISLDLCHNFLTVINRGFILKTLSNDDLMTFILHISILEFIAASGIHDSQTHLVLSLLHKILTLIIHKCCVVCILNACAHVNFSSHNIVKGHDLNHIF